MNKSPLTATIDPQTGWLTVRDGAGQNGWFGLQFYLIVDGQPTVPVVDRSSGAQLQMGADRTHGEYRAQLELGATQAVRLRIEPSPTGRGWAVTPVLRNVGHSELRFTGYGFGQHLVSPGVRCEVSEGGIEVFAHTDNLRYENLPHCRVTFPFIRPLPESPRHLGVQGQGAMPVLVLGQTARDQWLVEGALTQRRHLISWHLGLCAAAKRWADCRSEFTWLGGAVEAVPPGGEVELETTVFLSVSAAPDRVHAAYIEELTTLHQFAGTQSRLAREPVFCTWNFSVFFNITEADCLKRMDLVAEIQRGGFFQIDHGYQAPVTPGGPPPGVLDDFYPDAERAWDLARFPSGPRGFVAACRQRGLRPSLWWTPRLGHGREIAREHPEWLLCDQAGRPVDVGHLVLDFSVPEVRAFCEASIRTVTKDWGFEGIKLDFFSYAFDHPAGHFRRGGTHLEWKRWLIEMIRQQLGPRGYFLHCVSTPLGNPFYALNGCDAFRGGNDIDRGDWEQHVRCCGWMLPLALATGRQTWFINLDSCMGKPEIPAVERRSRNALAYVTAGMLEFSGPLERFDEAMRAEYRRLVERYDQGGGVRCPDTAAFYGRPLPRVLVREHAPGSRTRREFGVLATVGLFNWTDGEQLTAVSLAELGLDAARVTLRDFWTGAAVPAAVVTLPPRGQALWDVVGR